MKYIMNEERIWLLLSLRLSNEATAEELAELETALQEHPELASKAKLISNLWQSQQQAAKSNNTQLGFDKHLQRLSNHQSEPVLQFENAAEEPGAEGKLIAVNNRKRKWY